MHRFLIASVAVLLSIDSASGQVIISEFREAADLIPVPSILNNSVSNLHAEADSLWAGPYLSITDDGGTTWYVPQADSLFGTRNRLFSLDVEGQHVWVGLGVSLTDADGGGAAVPSAAGFLYSDDGGRTFTYRLPQLDAPGDSLIRYGASMIKALPVIVPQQSPPYDIDYDPVTGEVWVAGWASGIRKSVDKGRTWQRVVLPPDDLDTITPDESYDFELNPRGETNQGSYNHMGFSVLVDEEGVVWAGTPMGVNVSYDGGLSWQRTGFDATPDGLTGSWVVSIEEQPLPGRNTIWMATWNAGQRGENGIDGVTVSRDGGQTFEQVLIGENVIDFAFRGSTVYVAGRSGGLFISSNGGVTWQTVNDFYDRSRPDRLIRPGMQVNAVATTPDALWVGTDDGLFRSTDEGRTWTVFSTNVPLHPDEPTAAVPDVDTYAYPNPFSPDADSFVRIRYESDAASAPEVRVYDFAMNLIRNLRPTVFSSTVSEVTWDGKDDDGLRVSNGVYFYAVRVGERTSWGKILVLE